MPLPALASLEDFGVFVPRVNDDEVAQVRAARFIELAGAVVRRETRQTITAVADDEVTLWPSDGELVLPQRPVTAVTSVTVDPSQVVADDGFRWDAQGRLDRVWPGAINASTWGWWPDETMEGPRRRRSWGPFPVTVVYDHGYTEVPDDIVAVTLAIAVRMYQNPTGLQSESIDGYGATFGGATDVEKRILAAYRQPVGTTRVRR